MADAVRYWLEHGLGVRSDATVKMYNTHASKHVIPALGARKLRDLSVEDVDKWLAGKTSELGTRSLKLIHGVLNRSVKSAMRRDKVKRNVVDLCDVPEKTRRTSLQGPDADSSSRRPDAGGTGRRAHASLHSPLPADRRSHGGAEGAPLVTQRCVAALRLLKDTQDIAQEEAGKRWKVTDLVFCTRTGTPVTAHNVRRDFRKVVEAAGLTGREWSPRELRHSSVSVLSDSGVPIEDISRLVGHSNTVVTETVYRHQIRPVIMQGAAAMDKIFGS
ncbi:site-specific integrase [Nonomuraea sp. NPDC004297]